MATPLLLALVAIRAPSMASAQETIEVTKGRISFEVDWYDDGRENPYTVSFTKRGADSVYTFDTSGALQELEVGNTVYTFNFGSDQALTMGDGSQSIVADAGSRMLLGDGNEEADDEDVVDDVEADIIFDHHRRLYACDDCEQTWDTMCGIALDDVCYLVPFLREKAFRNFWTKDAKRSIKGMCRKFGRACRKSASRVCRGQCTDGRVPLCVAWRWKPRLQLRSACAVLRPLQLFRMVVGGHGCDYVVLAYGPPLL